MIHLSARLAGASMLAFLLSPVLVAVAQDQTPTTPAPAPVPQAPSAPAPKAPVFPTPDPADFTAAAPTRETINAFMQANLGFDANAMWQVQAIQKTDVPGMSKVVVFIGDKTGKQQPYRFAFFTTPDEKHIIVGERMIPFGDHPFAEYRSLLQQKGNGPYRGSASKDLELVEFADFQCPHCKEAQANMDKLVTDFPKARIVFENFPLPSIHPESVRAAQYGYCVNKLAGSTAFFQFAQAVFEGQQGLATPDGATLTLNSSVTKVGLDPAKVSACAATPEAKTNVDESTQLAKDLDINQVPTLVVNGRQVPANAPYDTLKQIIEYQARQDGAGQ